MDYVVTTGVLSDFENLWDKRLERVSGLDRLPVTQLQHQSAEEGARASFRREPSREFVFLQSFFQPMSRDHTVYYGFRDALHERGAKLEKDLKQQSEIPWAQMKYWSSDDDLILCGLKSYRKDMALLQKHYPPRGGEVFLSVGKVSFDEFEIYWRRRVPGSAKSKHDPMSADVATWANQALITVRCHEHGTFSIIRHPNALKEESVNRVLEAAARQANINLAFAPGLFS